MGNLESLAAAKDLIDKIFGEEIEAELLKLVHNGEEVSTETGPSIVRRFFPSSHSCWHQEVFYALTRLETTKRLVGVTNQSLGADYRRWVLPQDVEALRSQWRNVPPWQNDPFPTPAGK